jgi:hypothetical protein
MPTGDLRYVYYMGHKQTLVVLNKKPLHYTTWGSIVLGQLPKQLPPSLELIVGLLLLGLFGKPALEVRHELDIDIN